MSGLKWEWIAELSMHLIVYNQYEAFTRLIIQQLLRSLWEEVCSVPGRQYIYKMNAFLMSGS